MEEYLYVCYKFGDELTTSAVEVVFDVLKAHTDSDLLTKDGDPITPETLLETDSEATFTIDTGTNSDMPGVDYHLGAGHFERENLALDDAIWLSAWGTHFHERTANERARPNTNRLIDVSVEVYEALVDDAHSIEYVYGPGPTETHMYSTEKIEDPETHQPSNGVVDTLMWLQILPPKCVSEIGREEVLSAPAWRVEELSDGSVLLVAHNTPDPWVDGDFSYYDETKEYLDISGYLST